jgi:hypothetical protein
MAREILILLGFWKSVAAELIGLRPIETPGNPILGDGTYYSADPAPFMFNNTFYIVAGRDEAGRTQNDFVMNEWQVFSTSNPASSGSTWLHYPAIAKSNELFSWAARGRAYASQIVPGRNGKFYMYAPVAQARPTSRDPFGIGVGVSDSPTGPFRDAHPSGPIISQSVPPPGNNIQNIDPTVWVDDNGRAYIYFGTFGQLRGYELQSDSESPIMPISESIMTCNSPVITPEARNIGDRSYPPRLLRSTLALQEKRYLLHDLRRQQRGSKLTMHANIVPCMSGMGNCSLAIGPLDIPRRFPRHCQ